MDSSENTMITTIGPIDSLSLTEEFVSTLQMSLVYVVMEPKNVDKHTNSLTAVVLSRYGLAGPYPIFPVHHHHHTCTSFSPLPPGTFYCLPQNYEHYTADLKASSVTNGPDDSASISGEMGKQPGLHEGAVTVLKVPCDGWSARHECMSWSVLSLSPTEFTIKDQA